MTYLSHIVKATKLETGEDVVYLFTRPDDAERKLSEYLSENSGFTGAVIYKNVEDYGSYEPYQEELYNNRDSRYIENLDHIGEENP